VFICHFKTSCISMNAWFHAAVALCRLLDNRICRYFFPSEHVKIADMPFGFLPVLVPEQSACMGVNGTRFYFTTRMCFLSRPTSVKGKWIQITELNQEKQVAISCRWQTRATRCITTNGKILKQSRDYNHAPFVGDMSPDASLPVYKIWRL